jgi:hypothetical protein
MTSITLDDILQTINEPVSDLPLKTIIEAYFDGTKHMHDFSHEVMIPQLKALLGPTAQEVALRDIYFKMYLFLRSAITMNRLDHFQSVAGLTRSLFELLLDMKILATDKTGDAVKRYTPYPEYQGSGIRDQEGAAPEAASERGRGGGWQASVAILSHRDPAFPGSSRVDDA